MLVEGIIDIQRRLHAESERMKKYASDLFSSMPRTHKARLQAEHFISRLIDRIISHEKKLQELYEDKRGQRRREMEALKVEGLDERGNGDFSKFYQDLQDVLVHYGTSAGKRDESEVELEGIIKECRLTNEAFDAMFSGEESGGRYLDLNELYHVYINLPSVKKIEYIAYIEDLDNFGAVGSNLRQSSVYHKYLEQLYAYLRDFLGRTRPLEDIDAVEREEKDQFEERWSLKHVAGWEFIWNAGKAVSNFCAPCNRAFSNASVYQAHFVGKKHQRAAAGSKADTDPEECQRRVVEEHSKKYKRTALLEALISEFMSNLLAEVREETRANVYSKSNKTMEERIEDVNAAEEEPAIGESEKSQKKQKTEDVDTEERIYNPLKLPLDWDGKPIPYWLWKLHGLGTEYPCEICGNYIYKGRRAFDMHFTEWRHANAMKCLGIPNSKHFFQISKIEDAQTLWEQIRAQSKMERFRPEAMEEFEDQQGNVYNRKTYEDLRKQGLL